MQLYIKTREELPEAVADITFKIMEDSRREGSNGEKKTSAEAVTVQSHRVQLLQWKNCNFAIVIIQHFKNIVKISAQICNLNLAYFSAVHTWRFCCRSRPRGAFIS